VLLADSYTIPRDYPADLFRMMNTFICKYDLSISKRCTWSS